jgi:hypothetical protein
MFLNNGITDARSQWHFRYAIFVPSAIIGAEEVENMENADLEQDQLLNLEWD